MNPYSATEIQHTQGIIASVQACPGSEEMLNYQPLVLDIVRDIVRAQRIMAKHDLSCVLLKFVLIKLCFSCFLPRKSVCTDKTHCVNFKFVSHFG